jgi:hypothetical protein
VIVPEVLRDRAVKPSLPLAGMGLAAGLVVVAEVMGVLMVGSARNLMRVYVVVVMRVGKASPVSVAVSVDMFVVMSVSARDMRMAGAVGV